MLETTYASFVYIESWSQLFVVGFVFFIFAALLALCGMLAELFCYYYAKNKYLQDVRARIRRARNKLRDKSK